MSHFGAEVVAELPRPPHRAVKLVDCDVHAAMSAPMIAARMSRRWRAHCERFGFRGGALGSLYPSPAHGETPGSDPLRVRRQLLDEYAVDYAVLNPFNARRCYERPELAQEIVRVINDWIAQEWLAGDARLLGALRVAHEYPELAVAEIARRAASGRWVQVQLPAQPHEAPGARRYWPIYEAAAAHGLPVALHAGDFSMQPGSGWPSYYLETHTARSFALQTALTSLVCNGVFAAIPGLKVVLTGGGVAWLTPLAQTLDQAWQQLRDDVPHLDRRPSEYIREHAWLTVQPFEAPENPRDLLVLLEHGDLYDRLLFASDFPNWDFGPPKQALPRAMPPQTRRRVYGENACALYGLPP